MSNEYGSQLIESVAVRRRRLREAWLFGVQRTRQTMDEGVTRMFAGAAIGALVCAGCVGWSFVDKQLAQQKRDEQQRNTPASVTSPSPSTSPTPTGPALPSIPGLTPQPTQSR